MGVSFEWYDWVGFIGSLMILGSFFLLQAGRMSGTGYPYQLLNLIGPAFVLVSLLGKFNLSVFVLEVAWILVSVYGIARNIKLRRGASQAPG